MAPDVDKPLVWLHGEITTPPLPPTARIDAGVLLTRLQRGQRVGLPHSRPMPTIGRRCHELRIVDRQTTWRLLYRIDRDTIVIVDLFRKTTQTTHVSVIDSCRRRLRRYDAMCDAGG